MKLFSFLKDLYNIIFNFLDFFKPYKISIIDKYIFKRYIYFFLGSTLLLMLFTLSIKFAMEVETLFRISNSYKDGNYKILYLYLSLIPWLATVIIPFTNLFSALFTIGSFYKTREGMAYIAAGVYVLRISLSIIIFSMLIVISMIFISCYYLGYYNNRVDKLSSLLGVGRGYNRDIQHTDIYSKDGIYFNIKKVTKKIDKKKYKYKMHYPVILKFNNTNSSHFPKEYFNMNHNQLSDSTNIDKANIIHKHFLEEASKELEDNLSLNKDKDKSKKQKNIENSIVKDKNKTNSIKNNNTSKSTLESTDLSSNLKKDILNSEYDNQIKPKPKQKDEYNTNYIDYINKHFAKQIIYKSDNKNYKNSKMHSAKINKKSLKDFYKLLEEPKVKYFSKTTELNSIIKNITSNNLKSKIDPISTKSSNSKNNIKPINKVDNLSSNDSINDNNVVENSTPTKSSNSKNNIKPINKVDNLSSNDSINDNNVVENSTPTKSSNSKDDDYIKPNMKDLIKLIDRPIGISKPIDHLSNNLSYKNDLSKSSDNANKLDLNSSIGGNIPNSKFLKYNTDFLEDISSISNTGSVISDGFFSGIMNKMFIISSSTINNDLNIDLLDLDYIINNFPAVISDYSFKIDSSKYINIKNSFYKNIQYRLDAEYGIWDYKNNTWVLFNVIKKTFNGNNKVKVDKYEQYIFEDSKLSPDYIYTEHLLYKKFTIDHLSFSESLNIIKKLSSTGIRWHNYYIDLYYKKIFRHFGIIIMLILALLRQKFYSRNINITNSILNSILIYVAYTLFDQIILSILQLLGVKYYLIPYSTVLLFIMVIINRLKYLET